MRSFLNKVYGFLKRLIVPGLRYSQDVYEEVLRSKVEKTTFWLDVGCGHQILPPWRLEQEIELVSNVNTIVGVDLDFGSIGKHKTIEQTAQCRADALPFRDDQFDIVTANMVVEHLDNPAAQFAEMNRVLRNDGMLIFHTVNRLGYFVVLRRLVPSFLIKKLARLLDGRLQDDVFEVQYKANDAEKIQRLAAKTGFGVEKIIYLSSDATFALVPPLALAELLWIKALMAKSLRRFRTNLIVILHKKSCGAQ